MVSMGTPHRRAAAITLPALVPTARSASERGRSSRLSRAGSAAALLEVERGWRDLKTTLDLRPVYHRREDRNRAHILLCWLALLLIRIAESRTGHTWAKIEPRSKRIHVGVFTGTAGTFRQRTELSQPQRAIPAKLKVAEPPPHPRRRTSTPLTSPTPTPNDTPRHRVNQHFGSSIPRSPTRSTRSCETQAEVALRLKSG